jgi:hypothetical protein
MAKSTKGKLSAIEAVLEVLSDGQERRVPQIIAEAVPKTNLGGKTPGQTIYSVLYAELKKPTPRVERVSKGTFKLAAPTRDVEAPAEVEATVAPKPKRRSRTTPATAG